MEKAPDLQARTRVMRSTWAVAVAADSHVRSTDAGNYEASQKTMGELREAVIAHREAMAALGLVVLHEESRLPVDVDTIVEPVAQVR
jgi:hypothetical protein